MTYEIRPILKKDLPQLIRLCAEHAAYEDAHFEGAGKEEQLARALFSPKIGLLGLVAVHKETAIGYATFIRQYSTWDAGYYLYMDCLFISEAHRGVGLGKKILQEINQTAAKLKCIEVQWQTPLTNEQAIRFYEREGAKKKKKARFFLRPQETQGTLLKGGP